MPKYVCLFVSLDIINIKITFSLFSLKTYTEINTYVKVRLRLKHHHIAIAIAKPVVCAKNCSLIIKKCTSLLKLKMFHMT